MRVRLRLTVRLRLRLWVGARARGRVGLRARGRVGLRGREKASARLRPFVYVADHAQLRRLARPLRVTLPRVRARVGVHRVAVRVERVIPD